MCEKYEGLNWGDLPKGTRIIGPKYYGIVQSRSSILYINTLGHTKIIDPHKENWCVSSVEEVIIPHGYQSPLWKVLNGEEI